MDGLQALGDLRRVGELHQRPRTPEQLPRPAQTFFDGVLARQEGVGDLGHAETAQGLQDERHLGFGGELRRTAGKHHAQLVVLDLVLNSRHLPRQVLPVPHQAGELRGEVAEVIVPPQEINGPVAGRPHEPAGGIVWNAVQGPRLQGPIKSVLDHVLGQVETAQPEDPGQVRDHLSRLLAEKMVDQSLDVLRRGPPRRSSPTWKRWGGSPPIRRLPGWDSPWTVPPPGSSHSPRRPYSPRWSPWPRRRGRR